MSVAKFIVIDRVFIKEVLFIPAAFGIKKSSCVNKE